MPGVKVHFVNQWKLSKLGGYAVLLGFEYEYWPKGYLGKRRLQVEVCAFGFGLRFDIWPGKDRRDIGYPPKPDTEQDPISSD